MIKAIVGLNWGDEGKGRMVDYLAEQSACVIRYQGGDNAGHTVINDSGKFVLHNIPSGIFNQKAVNIIGSGSVINPETFIEEVEGLKSRNVACDNLLISNRAILILPFHKQLDTLEDQRMGKRKYGSTLSGIAPVYGDKYLKKGIQVGELFYPDYLEQHLKNVVEYNNLKLQGIYQGREMEYQEIVNWLMPIREKILPYITDTQPTITKLLEQNKKIILEAQLGALRDITHGIYPYTTSSSTLAAYAAASLPITPAKITEIIGVTKAYSTSVGAGAFVTEIKTSLAEQLRAKAGEYGASTGRPRRIGYFDAVATGYGCQLQGATSMVISCLDILSGLKELKICTHYQLQGKKTKTFPLYPGLLQARPVYEVLPGWQEDITGIRNYHELPVNARSYVERIAELCQTPVKYLSVGPERESLIILP